MHRSIDANHCYYNVPGLGFLMLWKITRWYPIFCFFSNFYLKLVENYLRGPCFIHPSPYLQPPLYIYDWMWPADVVWNDGEVVLPEDVAGPGRIRRLAPPGCKKSFPLKHKDLLYNLIYTFVIILLSLYFCC